MKHVGDDKGDYYEYAIIGKQDRWIKGEEREGKGKKVTNYIKEMRQQVNERQE